ncbi:MAG: pyridoxal-phosphate dependent enzyme [candidate division Zixibacteria bacterium]|nr:pyridoxal-phosphate dependent enzyme [candidate division Zixibacteria bacterium]
MAQLICGKCDATYQADQPIWRCDCGGSLDLEFKPVIEKKKIASRKPTMWRYREALPIAEDSTAISFDEGFTPLLELEFNGKPVLVKQDHIFQTGSYKDRGAAVLVSKARELGVTEVVEDSSGNAGSAIAAYCALAGIKCHVYVPEKTSPGKLAQIKSYGAHLHLISGSREETSEAALEAAEKIYYASHSWNPYFFQGTKTFAYEVCEQLGWRSPDIVILPVGNGTLLLGASIGFDELKSVGAIDKIPKLIAVQAKACAPLYEMFRNGLNETPSISVYNTVAEGIAIAEPIRGEQIIEAVVKSKGDFLIVTEDEIGKSLMNVCQRGFYIEPTAAATIAGLEKYLLDSSGDELIVTAFTGHGLKSTDKMMKITTG